MAVGEILLLLVRVQFVIILIIYSFFFLRVNFNLILFWWHLRMIHLSLSAQEFTGRNFLLVIGIYFALEWSSDLLVLFALVKEDREAMEGTGNPAFNMSSPDLLAHQTSDKRVIRHDMPGHTLAAHRQKFGLLASAEPKGVTSVLIIFIVADSCCTCDLTGASWSWHQAFHSSVSTQASWLWMEHGGHT